MVSNIEQISGYGISKRGQFELEELRTINEDNDSKFDIMFMLDSKPYEYSRVGQYRRLVDVNGEPTLEIMRSEEDLQRINYHSSVGRHRRKLKKRNRSDACVDPEWDFVELYHPSQTYWQS